ncbi:MAG: hypothetical protein R3B91_01675 [Planctomycetaceae bacterium]
MRRHSLLLALLLTIVSSAHAGSPRALPEGEQPNDVRLGPPENLNGYFPFHQVDSVDAWPARQAEIRRRILVSQGLWPLPTKAPSIRSFMDELSGTITRLTGSSSSPSPATT